MSNLNLLEDKVGSTLQDTDICKGFLSMTLVTEEIRPAKAKATSSHPKASVLRRKMLRRQPRKRQERFASWNI